MRNLYPHTPAELDAQLWEEITESRYYELLNCVPPRLYGPGSFVVGKEFCCLIDGTSVWQTCAQCDGKYYTRPNTLARFKTSIAHAEIRRQISQETVQL